MAMKFHNVYLALSNKEAPPEDEWLQFLDHCLWEFQSKLKRYNRPDLAQDELLLDDMMGNLMCEILKSIPRFDPERSTFKNYVDQIILNITRLYFRDQKHALSIAVSKSNEVDLLDFQEDLRIETSPEKMAVLREELRELKKLLNQLSSYQYQVVYCRIVLGLTSEETAVRLGKTKPQIINTLNKALERLRQLSSKI